MLRIYRCSTRPSSTSTPTSSTADEIVHGRGLRGARAPDRVSCGYRSHCRQIPKPRPTSVVKVPKPDLSLPRRFQVIDASSMASSPPGAERVEVREWGVRERLMVG